MDPLYMSVPRLDVLEFLALVEEECGGDRRWSYKTQCDSGEYRFGQAFMNALRGTEYYEILTGSLYDPFHKNDYYSIHQAIEYLTTKVL